MGRIYQVVKKNLLEGNIYISICTIIFIKRTKGFKNIYCKCGKQLKRGEEMMGGNDEHP